MSDIARRAAERVARESHGRLIALLAARTRDIAAAEDALSEAFRAALATWPERGVPDRPEAWLLTAAKRTLGHARRHDGVRAAAEPMRALIEAEREAMDGTPFGDHRLGLMFACTHPAVAGDIQAPLMLQAVLGLDAARIAASFLIAPTTMGQRLSRAKAKIRDAGVPFAVPDPAEAGPRMAAVLAAIYAAYGTGWDDRFAGNATTRGLAEEALWLGRLAVALAPADAEAMGLLALILYCESRASARRDAGGAFVPLDRQDRERWDAAMIGEAEGLLRQAAARQVPGRFQIEAAIQSHQMVAASTRHAAPPDTAAMLHDLLVRIAPSIGAQVARAVAHGEAGRAAEGLAMLEVLGEAAHGYQPWWAARAHLLGLLGRADEARAARVRAAGMTDDPAVRAWLLAQE
ncbi:RNA polymerase sigma factor [Sphingomonas sp. CJ99]